MIGIATSFAGMALILIAAVALSTDRRAIRPRVVVTALALQGAIAFLALYVPAGRAVLAHASGGVAALLGYAGEGSRFLFGPLLDSPLGRGFALQALPVIVFFAALVAILYQLGVMQAAVRWIGGGLQRATGVSDVESLCAAANIFVGQSEAPLAVEPYLAALTPAQLFTVMTTGMAGVAGTILAAYAALGIRVDYLLAASVMAAPGGIAMAKIMLPDGREETPIVPIPPALAEGAAPHANVIMAAAHGAQTGVKLAAAVGGTVLAFVAIVALANGLLGGAGHLVGVEGLSFQRIVGWVFAPVMALIGVPWAEAGIAGGLFGEKIVLNEFVAYLDLQRQADALSPRAIAVVTFALCGFANFSSIAVQIAVTGGLAPNQRATIARLGLRALAAGSLANLMSAAWAGLLVR